MKSWCLSKSNPNIWVAFLFFISFSIQAQKEQNLWYLGISAKIDFNYRLPKVFYDSLKTYATSVAGNFNPYTPAICFSDGQLKAIWIGGKTSKEGIYNEKFKFQFGITKDFGEEYSSILSFLYPSTNNENDFSVIGYNQIYRVKYIDKKFSLVDSLKFPGYYDIKAPPNKYFQVTKINKNKYLIFHTTASAIYQLGYTYLPDSLAVVIDDGITTIKPKYFSSHTNFGFDLDKVRQFNADTSLSIQGIRINPQSNLIAIYLYYAKDSIVNDVNYRPSLHKFFLLKLDTESNTLAEFKGTNSNFNQIFDFDFSPDGRSLFYIDYSITNRTTALKKLTWDSEVKSEVVAYPGENRSFNNIRLAPNGKIYVSYNYLTIANNSTLGVINYPNRDACCVCFQPDGLSLLADQNFIVYLPQIFKTPPYPEVQDSIAGVASVCPNAKAVPYFIVPDTNYANYNWFASGGSVLKQSALKDSVYINWASTNANANVTLVRTHKLGCMDTTIFPVKIDTVLKTQTPAGPIEICATRPITSVSYHINPTPESIYTWQASSGNIIAGQGSSDVDILFNGFGKCEIFIAEQTNTSSNRCLGGSDTLMVNIYPSPLKNSISTDFGVCQFSNIEVGLLNKNTSSTYQWQSGTNRLVDSTISSYIFQFKNGSNFPLVIREINEYGCEAKIVDTLLVPKSVRDCIRIPNIFTPNGDNFNETFEIEGIELFPENELTIYNRWGSEIIKQKHYANSWNASGVTDGLYYYLLDIYNGSQKFKGWVLVAR